jgi:hypothetical protein
MNTCLEVRFAALCHDLGKGNTHATALPRHIGHEGRSVKLLRGVCERLRVPQACKELAEVVAREHGHIHGCLGLSAEAVLRLLVRCDALRRPDRFALALQACEADARGRLGLHDLGSCVSVSSGPDSFPIAGPGAISSCKSNCNCASLSCSLFFPKIRWASASSFALSNLISNNAASRWLVTTASCVSRSFLLSGCPAISMR